MSARTASAGSVQPAPDAPEAVPGSMAGSMATAAAKAALRRRFRAARAALDPACRAHVDAAIAARVAASPAFERAAVILTYLSFGAEVDTRELIRAAWRAGKVVAVPRVLGPHELGWYRIDSFDGLERSPHGMEEPAPDPQRAVDPQDAFHAARMLALVPGLAFDRAGYRLGYGGGFYDAFLRGFPGTSLGLCRAASLVPSLGSLGAREPHDMPVARVVTENADRT